MKNKASLWQRIVAFIIDSFILSFAVFLLSSFFIDYESIEKLDNNYTETVEKALNNEISIDVFTAESARIAYRLGEKQGVTMILTLLFSVLYFVVYQYYSKGQTIGKKFMKIRVVSSNNNSLTMDNYIYRSLVINSLLVNILIFMLLLFSKDMVYFVGVAILRFIDYIILIVSSIMIICNKDKRGLQDMVANTDVVRV